MANQLKNIDDDEQHGLLAFFDKLFFILVSIVPASPGEELTFL